MNSKQLFITCLLACVAVASARSFIAEKMYQKFREQHEQHSESESVLATAMGSFLEVEACPQTVCCAGSGKLGSMKCPHVGGICCAGSDFCCPANHKCAAKADGMHCLKLAGGAFGASENSEVSESAVLNAFENSLAESSSLAGAIGAPSIPAGASLSGALVTNTRIPIPSSTVAGVPPPLSASGSLGPAPASFGSPVPPAPGASQPAEDSKPQTINIVSHIILQTHKKKGGGIEVTAVPAK